MHLWCLAAERLRDGRGEQQVAFSGITPSGEFHIGQLLEILSAEMIHRACLDAGLDSRYIFIVDSMDPLRRVYSFLSPEYERYIGCPLAFIPAPDSDGNPDPEAGSYADHFLSPFLEALGQIGEFPEVIMNHETYSNGKFSAKIHSAIEQAAAIREIIESISKDKTVKKSVKQYEGLRIFKQDPFQCMISFIISSNSNIQKIKSSLEKITRKFGTKIKIEDKEFFVFPKPEKIGNASINEIKACGVGYRASFVKEAAKMVTLKKIDFEYLKKCDYNEAKKNICLVPGIGNKVADCIMLFSLNKLEAFPLDTWMIKILEKYYSNEFKIETKTITEKQYQVLHEKIVNYFGPYCGYAQQFLFKMERESHNKKWL